MIRILVGLFSILLFGAASMVWWQSSAQTTAIPDVTPNVHGHSAVTRESQLPDPPSASKASREEKRFNRYDKDRDGLITEAEYLASRRKAYAKLDANGDGRLSFEEWSVRTREKFVAADRDRSRTLSRTEFETTAPKRRPKIAPDCPRPSSANDADDQV